MKDSPKNPIFQRLGSLEISMFFTYLIINSTILYLFNFRPNNTFGLFIFSQYFFSFLHFWSYLFGIMFFGHMLWYSVFYPQGKSLGVPGTLYFSKGTPIEIIHRSLEQFSFLNLRQNSLYFFLFSLFLDTLSISSRLPSEEPIKLIISYKF